MSITEKILCSKSHEYLLEENGKCSGEQAEEIRQIVNMQNDLLGEIYGNLQKGLGIERESFDEMSRLEGGLVKVLPLGEERRKLYHCRSK